MTVGLLGAGNVGGKLLDLILGGEMSEQFDVEVEVAKVFARQPEGKRWYQERPELFTTDPDAVVNDPRINVIVDALGSPSVADLDYFKELVVRALDSGKHVITANKALLAKHGALVREKAAENSVSIRFEAAVAGGIPILRSLSQGLRAERPEALYSILNGTSNFVLTTMPETRQPYRECLAVAQEKGYAEPNPEADVSGSDAESKLIVLASVLFGSRLREDDVLRLPITKLTPVDFDYAKKKGAATIKPLAILRLRSGSLEACVAPFMVSHAHPLASVDGVLNGVVLDVHRSPNGDGSSRIERYIFIGPGAGPEPTAHAILGDVYELAQEPKAPSLATLEPASWSPQPIDPEDFRSRFYTRFVVHDRPGIVGEITNEFGKNAIHVSEIWQLPHSRVDIESLEAQSYVGTSGALLPFAITLGECSIKQLKAALKEIQRADFVEATPLWLPIWTDSPE